MARKPRRKKSQPTDGWWGDGPSPAERWPGVTIDIPATWNGRRKRWESPCGAYYFDPDRAQRPVDFFPAYLVHTKGQWAGKPFELLPWQSELLIRPLFGWIQSSDGARRFRHVLTVVAKKNGKSGLASGLGIYLLSADGEPGAEVYAAASGEEQARIVYGESKNMVDESPELERDAGLKAGTKAITQIRTRSTFKVLSKAVATKHGFNVHGLIFDEFHTQKTRELWDTLYKGMSSRHQPVSFVITTAGHDRQSICYERLEHARAVRDGERDDPRLLPVIFEIGPADDWTDEEVWHKANPSLGVIKSIEYMRDECRDAQQEPRKRNSFMNLELNVWTESRMVWIAPESFEILAREEREPPRLADLQCTLGIDLSSTVDLTSVVAAFREPMEGEAIEVKVDGDDEDNPREPIYLDFRVHLIEHYWIPGDRMRDRIHRDRVPYDLWAEQGWVTVTPGAMIHYGAIYQHVLEWMDRWTPKQVAYDPWSATDIAQRLTAQGVPMVEVRQGYGSLSNPSKAFEALILAKRLSYSGSPITRWNVANCEIQSDPAGNIKPVKPDPKGPRRIDGVAATVNALSRLLLLPDERKLRASDYVAWV